jgi:hypothetical protein
MRNLNVAVAALLAAISAGLPARADDQRVVDALNAPWKAVNESS